jgi:hypothetical protein
VALGGQLLTEAPEELPFNLGIQQQSITQAPLLILAVVAVVAVLAVIAAVAVVLVLVLVVPVLALIQLPGVLAAVLAQRALQRQTLQQQHREVTAEAAAQAVVAETQFPQGGLLITTAVVVVAEYSPELAELPVAQQRVLGAQVIMAAAHPLLMAVVVVDGALLEAQPPVDPGALAGKLLI